jgi:hypothetical protein
MSRLRVAWFSPWRVQHGFSRAAYLTRTVLPSLPWDVTLFHSTPLSQHALASSDLDSAEVSDLGVAGTCRLSTAPFQCFAGLDRRQPFDLVFYHLESHAELDYSRIALGAEPGILFCHEIIPANHGPDPILASPWRDTVEKFNRPSRPWHEYHKDYRLGSRFARRELSLSWQTFFWNERDLRLAADTLCDEVHLDLPEQGLTSRASRFSVLHFPIAEGSGELNPVQYEFKHHDTADQEHQMLKCALYGGDSVEWQVHKIFAALQSVSNKCQIVWCLASTQHNQAALDHAHAIVGQFGLGEQVQITEQDPGVWERVVSQADVIFMPCFSADKCLEPFLSIARAQHTPLFVSDFGDTALLDDPQCIHMPTGAQTTAFVMAALQRLAKFPKRPLARLASAAAPHHAPTACAEDLLAFADAELEHYRQFRARWKELRRSARMEISRVAELSNPVWRHAAHDLSWLSAGGVA